MREEKKYLRAGLVGSGFAARFHYEALERVYGVNVEVVGVYSPTRKNREAFAAERGIRPFSSLDELIQATDVLHVCTPPVTHEPVAVQALRRDRSVIIEKPFTGYFGDGDPSFNGRTFSRSHGLEEAVASIKRMREAEAAGRGRILYAENWVYAPSIQKEREIIEKSGAHVLWLYGMEAHSGSHSPYYGIWSHSGGGSLMGKGVHPLTACLYLKRVEGRARLGKPIRPLSASARVHSITGSDQFRDLGHLKTGYTDVEDFAQLHVLFEDGTVADIFASELLLGGVRNNLEVVADNHRGVCSINPNTSFMTYTPDEQYLRDVYVVEKTETKQGWAFTSPDEDWFTGYQHEMEAFYRSIASDTEPESDSQLAGDTIAVVYAGYCSAEQNGTEVAVPRIS
ncbi:MAG: gfo/Idh/MocA family oxidoreductase [Spirochaetaceae bacterium]|nr:MAG: gfo/Idh/MocA family oxidoreductase [Spirochaetaceae bacterium]